MKIEELLNFCKERGVEVFTSFDKYTNNLIIRMRKDATQRGIDVAVHPIAAASAGFGLTLRVILRNMADELDKEGGGK